MRCHCGEDMVVHGVCVEIKVRNILTRYLYAHLQVLLICLGRSCMLVGARALLPGSEGHQWITRWPRGFQSRISCADSTLSTIHPPKSMQKSPTL